MSCNYCLPLGGQFGICIGVTILARSTCTSNHANHQDYCSGSNDLIWSHRFEVSHKTPAAHQVSLSRYPNVCANFICSWHYVISQLVTD